MATEGFSHIGQTIFSVIYELEASEPTRAELVVLLDSDGIAYNGSSTAHPPDRPIVLVKPGEWLAYKGKPRLVLGVEVYRQLGRSNSTDCERTVTHRLVYTWFL